MVEKKTLTRLGVAALLVALMIAAFCVVKYTDIIEDLGTWFDENGTWGGILFCAAMVIWVILCLPITYVEILCGYIYGFWLGLLISTIGKTIGNLISFWIGHFVGREEVLKLLNGKKYAVLRAIAHLLRTHPVKTVFLVRMAMFPMAVKNYGLSVLGVPLWLYMISSVSTGLIYTALWSYIGAASQSLTDAMSGESSGADATLQIVLIVVGAISALAVVTWIGYYTRKQIREMIEHDLEEESATEKREKDFSVDGAEPSGRLGSILSRLSTLADRPSIFSTHLPATLRGASFPTSSVIKDEQPIGISSSKPHQVEPANQDVEMGDDASEREPEPAVELTENDHSRKKLSFEEETKVEVDPAVC